MNPKFFELSKGVSHQYDETIPWAVSLTCPFVKLPSPPCRACGAQRMAFRGEGYADGLSGDYWGDIIGAGPFGPGFMLSERVIQGLREIGARGFDVYPVIIDSVQSEKLMRLPMPQYFYLNITGTIKIDWRASGLNEPCGLCGAPLKPQIKTPDWLIPVENGWDGSDIFDGNPYGGPFCTERIIHLARKHRWTNFRFYPVAADHDLPIGEGGIGVDYLGDEWPSN